MQKNLNHPLPEELIKHKFLDHLKSDGNDPFFMKFDLEVIKMPSAGDPLIEAVVSTTGNKDTSGDIIADGAFDEWLAEFNSNADNKLPMLYMHRRGEVIGEWNNFRMDGKRLIGEGCFFPEVSMAADALALFYRDMIASVSIGLSAEWEDVETLYEEDSNGHERFMGLLFHKVNVREVSMVDSPANPQTEVISVKKEDGTIDVRELEKLLKAAGLSHKESKSVISHARPVLNPDATKEEKAEGDAEDAAATLIKLLKDDDEALDKIPEMDKLKKLLNS